MDLSSKRVSETLSEKGVSELHHANSVVTSCQFLRAGALLSRGAIKARSLFQTAQSSDTLDKNYSLWFDVFTDSVDIHGRASRANAYGPVLFILDVEALRTRGGTGRIWITKKNPTKWKGLSDDDRWFRSVEELENEFTYGTFDHMIVFRHCGGELPIKHCLRELLVDDPRLVTTTSSVDYFSMAYGALRLAMTEGRFKVPIRKRKCRPGCRCRQEYLADSRKSRQMFFPKVDD